MIEPIQSALDPAGKDAVAIAQLSWVLFAGAAAILASVVALAGWALFAKRRPAWLQSARFIVAAGIVFPTVTLTALLVWGLLLTGGRSAVAESDALQIVVTGEQFWWRVEYPQIPDAPDSRGGLTTANEIRIPVGRQVELTLASADVIHSFWIPNLAGKLDMIPGTVNRMTVTATEPGLWRGQCAEFCGTSHALMAFRVVALEPDAFDQWAAQQMAPARVPAGADERDGLQLFLATGCGGCHTIRGTPATGTIGPDLTHVGGRIGIAADTMANDADAFARWLRLNQHIKPGNPMPEFDILTDRQLASIGAYLAGLE